MKRSSLNIALIATAIGTMAGGAAYASPMLDIDGSSVTLSPTLPDQYSYFDSVGGWDISGTVADYSPSLSPEGLDLTSYTATCISTTGCAGSPLTVTLTDTGFTTVVPLNGLMDTLSDTQSGSGTVVQTAYFDTSDTAFGMSGDIGSVTLNGSGEGSVSGGGPAGPSAYSLTLQDVFTATDTGGVTFSTDGDITTVPEPATFALFGAGLLGCAIALGRWRRRPRA